jgi:hypothetical protein
MHFEVPVLRRVLESILAFDCGFDQVDVTTALNSLTREDYAKNAPVFRTVIRLGDEPRPNHVYTYKRRPTTAELEALRALYSERGTCFDR